MSKELLFGPYKAPRVKVGGRLTCEICGTVVVTSMSGGPLPWPAGRPVDRPRGGAGFVLCGDLIRAVERESVQAIMQHWGVGPSSVTKWRHALEVKRYNAGTLVAVSRRLEGVYRDVDGQALREAREAAGLSAKELARRTGVACETLCEYERGVILRVRPDRLAAMAAALGVEEGDLAR